MQTWIFVPLLVLASADSAAAQSAEQQRPAQYQALLQCRSIADATQRLQCYDAAVGTLAEATEAGAVVVVDQEAIRRTRRTLFGFGLPRLPFLGRGDEGGEPDEIEATIRSASPHGYGQWLITVDDGAVWQTTEADTRSRSPKVGETATLRKKSLGSYSITWKGGRGVPAKRVR
ncbi:MAG TPA: hypothetical protein VFR36_04170 [Sphingomicrobium sp.]|nr:hypothetical protein [Sphingomicrobium sp.]